MTETDTEIAQIEPKRIRLDDGETTLIYFERRIEPHGVVRVQTWLDGIEIWVGGECRWRSRRRE